MPRIDRSLRIPQADAGDAHTMRFATTTISYRLVRSLRRTLALHIGHSGLEARAPQTAPLEDIEAFMRRKEQWILCRLSEVRQMSVFAWQPGAVLPLLGEPVSLRAAPGRNGIALEQGCLLLGDRGRGARLDWRRRIIAWIREQAQAHFNGRALEISQQLAVAMPLVRLSNAAGRWGSCSMHRTGPRVRLHWKLYLLPPALIDYVVAHELAHIRELNHSPRFWSLVAKLYPDYAAARTELNRRGRELPIL